MSKKFISINPAGLSSSPPCQSYPVATRGRIGFALYGMLAKVTLCILCLCISTSLAAAETVRKSATKESVLQKKTIKKKVNRKKVKKSSAKSIKKPLKSTSQALQTIDEKAAIPECVDAECSDNPSATRQTTPLGARISDALTRQDKQAAAEILEHDRVLLNDEMNLLSLAGRKNKAADIAFILMERASQDESLYEQAAPILMANARTSGVSTIFRAFESYNAYDTVVSSEGHALGRLKLDVSLHQESRNNINTAQLARLANESGVELALHQMGDSYVNTYKLQTDQALNTQTGASLKHQHKLGSRLKLNTLFAYNQSANENAALRIIGRSNHIALESAYTLDTTKQWMVNGAYHQYHSIDGEELGNASLFNSTLSYELSGIHPAIRTRITGTYNQFKTAAQALGGLSASLIPAGKSNTAVYFMPQNVSELAAYLSMGDATDSKLPARSLEYVAEIGAFDNPVTGSGWRASAGLAGRIIGTDRLHLFIRYDQSPNGQGFSSLEARLAYQLHY